MKCPKCNYVSHDYLDECRKCHIDLLTFKQQLGLFVLKPGILDLSLVLAGAENSSLLDNRMLVETEVAVHNDEEDFDISLEDYTEMPTDRTADGAPGMPRPLADHLTLELDTRLTTELSSGMLQGLEDLLPLQPPAAPAQGSQRLDRGTSSDHLTLELTSQDLPLDLLNAAQQPTTSSGASAARNRSLPIANGEETLSDEFPADLLDDTPNEPTVRLPIDPSITFSPDEPTSQLDVSKLRIDTTEEVIPLSEIDADSEELSFTIPTIEIANTGAQTIELEDESFDAPEVLGQETTTQLSLTPLVEEETPQLPSIPSAATSTSQPFAPQAKTEKMTPGRTDTTPFPRDTAELHLSHTFEELASFDDTDADIELELSDIGTRPAEPLSARLTPGQRADTPDDAPADPGAVLETLHLADTLSTASTARLQSEEMDDDLTLDLSEVGFDEDIDNFAPNFDTLDPAPTALESTETTRAGHSTSDTAEIRLRQTLQELAADTFDEADMDFEFPSADTYQATADESPQLLTPVPGATSESVAPASASSLEPGTMPSRQREKTGELPFERPPADQPSAPFDAEDVARAFESTELNPLSFEEDMVGIGPSDPSTDEPDFSAFDMPDLDPTDSGPEHLNLDLDTSDLTPELLTDTLDETELALEREDAGTASFSLDLQVVTEEVPSFDEADLALTSLDMPGAMAEEDEDTLGHLTLELDSSEFTEEIEQEAATPEEITLAFAEEESSPLPPPTRHLDTQDELILDLDDLDLDDDDRRS